MSNSNIVNCSLVAANGAANLSVNFEDVPRLGAGSYSWTEFYSGQTGTGNSISVDSGQDSVYGIEYMPTSLAMKKIRTM